MEPGDKQAIDRADERLSVSGVRRSISKCSGRNASFVASTIYGTKLRERTRKFPKAGVGLSADFGTTAVDDRTGVEGGRGRAGSLIAVRFSRSRN